jgi:hypothetical protein
MIRLECTNCKQTLTIEDAFAGGVCRCQFCGTIQTVPSNTVLRPHPSPQPLKPSEVADKAKANAAKPPKTLYRTPSAARAGSPNDPFGDITGSGLPGSGLPGSGMQGSGLPGSGIGGSGFPGSGMPSPRPSRPQMAQAPPTYDDLPDDTALLQGANAAPMPIASDRMLPPQESNRSSMLPILIGISLSVVVLLIVLIIVLTGRKSSDNPIASAPIPIAPAPNPTPPQSSSPTPDVSIPAPVVANSTQLPNTPQAAANHPQPPTPIANKNNPRFLGVKLTGLRTIVFVLDNGPSQQAILPDLNRAVLNSIASMPTSRSFHVEYWDSSASPSYPANGMIVANDTNAAAAAAVLNNLPAATDPDPDAALKHAAALRPNAIVLVTGRVIDDATRDRLLAILKGSPAKVFAFSISGGPGNDLQAIATATNGQYKDVSTNQLATFAK